MGDTRSANQKSAQERTGNICTKGGIARIFGFSVSWVEKIIKAGAPVKVKGRSGVPLKIDTAQFSLFLVQQEREKIEDKYEGIIGDPTSETESKRRMALARAEQEEIKTAKLRGEIVDLAIMEQILNKAIANTRALLLGIPTKAAPVLAVKTDPNEIQTELEKMIYEVLSELSGFNKSHFIDAEMLQAMGAATETDSESVGGSKTETKS